MKHETKITVEFWRQDYTIEIISEHRELLEIAGRSRALQMLSEGFTSGQLFETIDEVEYEGVFNINTKVIR